MIPDLRLAHGTLGRMRLRVTGRAPEGRWWQEVGPKLSSCPAVQSVSIRPPTGSVVVEHVGPRDEVLHWAREHDLFSTSDARAESVAPLDQIANALDDASERLRRLAGGELDLRTIAFYGLVGAGVLQAAAGRVFPAAETLLIHALAMLPRRDHPSEAASSPPTSSP